MNKQLKLLTCFVVFMLVAQSAPLAFGSSQVEVGNSNLVADASSFTFGNTAIGTYFDQNDANAKSASSFTCDSNGQITDIYAYVARTHSTGTGEAAIYADNSGQPGALIAHSNAESITTSYSWVDFQLPTPESVTSGTVYWLSICSDDALNFYVVTGSGVRVHNGNTYSGGFSNPFGSMWGEPDTTGAMSIYAGGNLDYSELSVTISPTSANITLGGYQQFTSTVTDGVSLYSYQWYLNDTAVSGGTSQNWFFTPSAIGTYNIYLNVTDAFNNEAQSNIVTNIAVYSSLYNFSIMQITDTQFLSSTYPDLYNQLTTWIVNNNATYNLKMVVHTGDIVNNYDQTPQWEAANTAMHILSDNGIPYLWCSGNHEQWGGTESPDTGWIGNQYTAFNPATFSGNSYWVGSDNEGKNTAVKFSVDGYNFLIVDIESMANSDTISWMTNLLNTYSNYNVIVATHAYLAAGWWNSPSTAPDGDFSNDLPGSPAWEQNLQNILNSHSNVIMTLNGHTDNAISVHNRENGREQIEFDRQAADNQQGADSVRIYTFDLSSKTVSVSTYSIWDSTWLTSSDNSFSFSTNLTSIPTVSITPTLVRMDVGQSQTFDSSVSGGIPPYAYQWYMNDNAISGATGATWTFTPTQSGEYNIYLNVADSLNDQIKSNVVSDIVVYAQPSVSISPLSTNITLGGFQQFNSAVTGGLAPYTYQWYYANGTAISGSTTSTLIYTTNFTGTYRIYLNATDSLNYRFQSNMAIINVYSQSGATITPTSLNMTVGGTQLFNSAVTGGLLPYTFQWYYTNGTKIIGATNPTLSYKANSTGTYNIYLNVTDSLNVKTQSNTVAIYVYSQPSVLINPTSVKMTIGTLQQFNSTALGGLTPYAYQWYLNDTAVTGATSSVWNFTPTGAGHFKVYLNITDELSFKVQSNIVTDITVYPKPTVSIIPTLVNMIVGTTQTFNSTVQGGAQPFTYQWVLNGTAVAGANSSLWNFTPTQTGHYSVYLNVTDSLNNQAQSNVAADILVYSQLSLINLVSGGSDYTTPVVLITGGGGSGATATARVSNGVIIGIVLTNPGSGYSSAPTVIIRDPSPRAKGASAIAVLGFL